jgi:glycine/D-amino acid oxidase-like deaminating enzyme
VLARNERPEWSVLVVDRGRPGGGATSWTAGLSDPMAQDPHRRKLVESSMTCFAGAPFSWYVTARPALAVVTAGERERLIGAVVGPPPVPASAEEMAWLARTYPDLVVEPDEEVLSIPGGLFVVDCAALVGALPEHGVSVWPGCRVERVERRTGGWVLTTTTDTEITAARVVLATGPWPAPDVVLDGEPLPGPDFQVKRVAALHVRAPRPASPPRVVAIPGDDLFLLPTASETLVSYDRNSWLRPGAEPTGEFDADDLAAGVAVLRRRSEALSTDVIGGRAAYDGYTAARQPLVDTRIAHRGLAWVVGGSGSGAHLAPGLAAAAIRALSGHPTNGEGDLSDVG